VAVKSLKRAGWARFPACEFFSHNIFFPNTMRFGTACQRLQHGGKIAPDMSQDGFEVRINFSVTHRGNIMDGEEKKGSDLDTFLNWEVGGTISVADLNSCPRISDEGVLLIVR